MLGTKSLNSKEKDHMYLFHGFISNLSLGMAAGNLSLSLIKYKFRTSKILENSKLQQTWESFHVSKFFFYIPILLKL